MILVGPAYVLPWLINLDVVGLIVIQNDYGTNVGDYFKVIINTLATLPGHDEICETNVQPFADQLLWLFFDMTSINGSVVHVRHILRGPRTRTLAHCFGGAGLPM